VAARRKNQGKSRVEAMAETREALLIAGAKEFVEKGLDGASLNGICARAGYTRGAFYVHFRDRDELLVAVVERELARFTEAIVASQDPENDLQTTVARYVAAVLGGAPAARGAGRWQFHHTLSACAELPKLREKYAAMQHAAIERVAHAARSGQKAKRVREDIDAKTIGEILVVLTLGVSAMLDVGAHFDLAAGGRGIAKMVAASRSRRARS
jgi:AcrR family transcriptional regulator